MGFKISPNQKLAAITAIITALISSAATITVPLIPRLLHQHDIIAKQKLEITGVVLKKDNSKEPLIGAEMILIPVSGGEIASTDNYGNYILNITPGMPYWIVVRDIYTKDKPSGRILINQANKDGMFDLIGANISYHIQNQQ